MIPKNGKPVLAGAPEGEKYAREMSVWQDYFNIREFACVSVPEEINYPLAKFSTLRDILLGALNGGKRLGLVGIYDIPAHIMDRIRTAVRGAEIEDAGPIINRLRIVKSANEIACLKEAGRQACEGYKKLLEYAVEVFRKYGGPQLPGALVRDAWREGQKIQFFTLDQFPFDEVQMTTLVLIGNSQTRIANGRMFCLRGYREKYGVGE